MFLYPIFVFSSFLTLNSNNSMNSPLSNIYNILSMYQFWNHKIYKPKRSLKKLTPNNENASMLELFSLGMEVPFQDLDANGKAKESHLMCDGCFKLLPKHLEHETLEMYESWFTISCYKQTSSCEGVSYTWQPWIGITILGAITTNPNHPEGNPQAKNLIMTMIYYSIFLSHLWCFQWACENFHI